MSQRTASTKLGPKSAVFILLVAGPLSIWTMIMFVLLVTGAAGFTLPGGAVSGLGLVSISLLCALACRRALNVLRSTSNLGGISITSIALRGALLIATLMMAHMVLGIWSDDRFTGAVSGGARPLLLAAGLSALVAATVTFVQGRKRRAP